jgi:AraC-like DNA-binding protein
VEITFVVQGSQTFNVGGEDYLVTGGEVFVSYKNEPHSTGINPQGVCEQYWLQLDLSKREEFLGLSPYWADFMYSCISNLRNRHFKIDKSYSGVLNEAIYKYNSQDHTDQMQAHCNLLSFINEVIKRESRTDTLTDDIVTAKKFIDNNVYNTISIEQVAQACMLSVSRLKTKFCSQVGMAPMQYYNYKRLYEAKIMLENGEKIIDVAYKLQFSSSSHFSNFFKKHTHMTPRQHQKSRPNMEP